MMRLLYPMNITKRVYLWLSVLILASAIVQGVVVRANMREFALLEREQTLFSKAAMVDQYLTSSLVTFMGQNSQLSPDEQAQALNQQLQPIINELWKRDPNFGLGYYSRELNRVIAVAPFDPKLIAELPKSYPLGDAYRSQKPSLHIGATQISWQGRSVVEIIYPIVRGGQVIGHAWANVKLDDIELDANQAATKTITLGLLLTALLISLSWIMFNSLHRELEQFSSAVVNEQVNYHAELLPELEPTLEKVRQHERVIERARLELDSFYRLSKDMFLIARGKELIRVNEACFSILGYSEQEFWAKRFLDHVHHDDLERTLASFTNIVRTGSERHFENRFLRKDGTVLWIHWSAHYDPGTGLIFAVGRDMTEAKRIEQEMIKLDRLNLSGQLAASIGHEIRNPMMVVRGFLQFMRSQDISPTHDDYYSLMMLELDRANAIITEFLSVAKTKPISKSITNLKLIVQSLQPLMQADALLVEKQLVVELEDVPDLLLDEKEIRQLLLNLVRNGLEATAAGGMITVKTYRRPNEIILSISDQGPGIPAEIMDKIFLPFFSTKSNGTGLGLAVCHRIAEQHDAKINVETGSNGTTFSVAFRDGVSVGEPQPKA